MRISLHFRCVQGRQGYVVAIRVIVVSAIFDSTMTSITHIFPRAVYDQALNKDPPLSRLAVAMAPKLSKSPNANSWSPEDTKEGTLPPFEVAKAFAFDVVLRQMESHLGKSCWQLLGEGRTAFTAKHLSLKGGGKPGTTAVENAVAKCKTPGWYPGKVHGDQRGRKPVFTEQQKREMARVAMETKRKLVRPTPSQVRAKLPRLSLNPETQEPASDWTIYKIFHSMCYDEREDDPWVYMYSPSKDFLSEPMKKSRVAFANFFLEHFPTGAWSSHVAVDPCISILATTRAQSDEQKVAAMGVKKMISPGSKYKGANLRASKTIKSQARAEDKVHWTPVFARGKVYIYVCDAEKARQNPELPARLNHGAEFAKFVRNVLPGILEEMQAEHGWARTPRTVVHDKASYFVAPRSQQLTDTFASALRASKLKSWLSDADSDCCWLAGRLGDVYPHETVISHIRRALDHRYPRANPGETRNRFANRMAKVQAYMNSDEFAARDGGGLAALAESLRDRCRRLSDLQGERLRS